MSQTGKDIVNKVNDAFSTGNMEAFYALCTEDVRWSMNGRSQATGVEALRKMMSNEAWNTPQFTVKALLADGDTAACEGLISMSKKSGERFEGAFCDVYQLRDGKVAELRSYIGGDNAGGSSKPA